MKRTLFLLLLSFVFSSAWSQEEDPYIWLEEVEGEKQLKWVEEWNERTLGELQQHEKYSSSFDKSLEIFNSSDRIARPSIQGEYVYNFWQDKDYVRGIWRRTSFESYKNGDPEWDILLNLDEMSEKDGIKWVYKGATGLFPKYDRFLVFLSKGGADATIIREFDVSSKQFIEGGFELEESKGGASWLDENTLMVYRDFGEGTMTTSGYPRQVKIWKRGTDITEAELLHEGNDTDVGTFGFAFSRDGKIYSGVVQATTFYTSRSYMYEDSKLVELPIPEDANISDLLGSQLVLDLKSDWEVNNEMYKQGAIVSADYERLIKGEIELKLIDQPTEKSSITSTLTTKNKLIINKLTNVKSELFAYSFENGTWVNQKVEAPEFGAIRLGSSDDLSDQYFFYYENFLTPSSLYLADADDNSLRVIKALPSYFDGSKFKVQQFEAKSLDGTMIPYYVIGAKDMDKRTNNPTLLYAYGGFEVSRLPFYSGTWGSTWLENGGVFVQANIRGGGEFGPKWHQAGIKENRQKVYNDFHSVAKDLQDRGITTNRNLGIYGGSNGGLLVGVAFTQRPDLYNAVICSVPLLDMKRYNKLLAGASWMGEYGNPDIPEEWEYISKYSPYHNVRNDMEYPEVFFMTSTRDDRVHPGHARKMVAKMADMGYKVYYYENTEGGHAGSSTNDQRAKAHALRVSYLLSKLEGALEPEKLIDK